MKFEDILKEELETRIINNEIAGLSSVKKQLDNIIAQNPLLSKSMSGPIADMDRKLSNLKAAVKEQEAKRKKSEVSGIGTQRTIVKPEIQTPTVSSTQSATTQNVKQTVSS